MSCRKLEEIKCPCGEAFEAELYNSINVSEDPDLKEALLSGEINVVCCPACGQIFHAEHFILYHDPGAELLAFVYPSGFAAHSDIWHGKMKQDFTDAMAALGEAERINYEPVALFGLDRLAELLRADEENDDEVFILEYARAELGLDVIKLKRSAARQAGLPCALPALRGPDKSARAAVIGGIKKLLAYNGNLLRFKELLAAIERDAKWTPEAAGAGPEKRPGRRK